MSLGNKAKDALMTGASKTKEITTNGINQVKDKAVESAKNSVVDGADKMTGGAISKTEQAIKLAKKLAQIAWNVIKGIIDFVTFIITTL